MNTMQFPKISFSATTHHFWRSVILAFALGLLVAPAVTAQSLVMNGGFETGDFTGWTLSGGGDIYVDDGSDSGTTPHSGNYEAEFGTPGELGYISQSLATTPGTTYLLSLWLNSPDGQTPNEFQVSWNGTTLFDETDIPAIGWTNIQFVVAATGSSTVLQFGAQDDSSYLALDDVSVVAAAGGSSGGHTNIAHYTFDSSGSLGQDSSGNGNDLDSYSYWGPVHQYSTDAEAGSGAVQFFGTSSMDAGNQVLTNLDAVLAGSFTFSAWVKTTVTNGADDDNAFDGAVIFWAYNDQGNTNDTIPLAITGSKAAFTTRDHLGNSTTLHSDTSVNDGNYHLITVTRDQTTGEKKIYVDGNFETSEIGTTDPLNGNNYNLNIGGDDYYTDDTGTNFSSYNGLLDDVQIYSGVLSASEVASQFANPGTVIPDVTGNSANGIVVHYDFDEGTVLAPDVSGNNNNMVYAGNFGGSGPAISSDAEAGAGAVSFDGGSYLTASSNLLATLAGDFTVSLWLNTSQSYGNPGDLAWEGAGVLCADSPNPSARDLIPVALTGGQVAFNVGDGSGNDDTLNSSATVNDGNWHHVVVTRSQASGQRQIFIDGALDSSDTATTGLLNSPVLLTVGAISDASNPDPTSPDENGFDGYQGLLDDIQIYSRVLSSTEVTFLYNNPGQTVAGTGGADFNTALDTTNLNWTTSGDASWFTETTNTYNGSPSAAQSGSVTGDQSSTLSLTVTGPGTLTFYWSSIANDPNQGFDCDFYINGNLYDYISGDSAWGMDSFNIPSGTSTLTWTADANSDTDPNEAAFLDQVSYVTAPSLTASANPQAGPAPLTVQFSTPSQDTGGFTVTNWNWSFGDGATSTAQNPIHTYLNPGTYSPSLFAYSTYSSSPLTIVNGFGTITATVIVTEPTNSFFNTLYSFTATTGSPATNSDGANPEARLIISGNTLYGTAYYGSSGFGAVFAININGASFTNLYSFTNGRDGAYPWAELLLSGQTLYGTASAYLLGGSGDWGTVFAINTNGTGFTNLYNFTGGNDGGYPHSGFVLSGSTLFGTAAGAGAAPNGTVFAINTNGTGFTNLHAFSGGSDGEYPNSSVILAGDTLYGSTYLGGNYGSGTVFAVNTNGQSFTDLVQFNVGDPQGSLILSGQTLYGATLYGGSSNSGAVFRVNTDGAGFTNIYSFTGGNDGSVPNCNLVLSGNTLYGTTSSGGDAGNGTVFMVDTNGMGFSLLHIFTSLVSGTNSDGANPQAGLILSGNTFYGTTAHGGPSGNGTVFSFTLSSAALPVTLVNPLNNGANFQFQFLSQAGFTHSILYRTNLVVGDWQTNSTVIGDGTITNISLPYSLFGPAKQGFIRVSTQ